MLLSSSVAPTVELSWPLHGVPPLVVVLMCLHVREIAVKRKVSTVRHDGFEDVGMLALGRDAVGGRFLTLLSAPSQSL